MNRETIIVEKKKNLRSKIWRLLAERKIARPPFPCHGRIPNFVRADQAAERLRDIPEFVAARSVLVSPDSPQRSVRELVVSEGETLVMATPRLKDGYILIEPPLRCNVSIACTIRGAYQHGRLIGELHKVDFVVEGCVAVDLDGNRLGKGGGYGDREIAEARRLDAEVKVAVTCHSIQVVPYVPRSELDLPVNYIATELSLIRCG